MSIFPDDFKVNLYDIIKTNKIVFSEELPVPKEYAWDFERNKFILEKGNNKIVTGAEAIKVWIYKTLNTSRYKYGAYSWDYGHELEELISLGLSREALFCEVQRYLNECLKVNPYIKAINNIDLKLDGSKLSINFLVDTMYSEVRINV
ncbi:DUF2634 domain-containing protein [Clostridium tagluense]|uniref:DUF2634 domain-containing protein n=1 Tax=Clostridium tagluense TaxID=360422 RepID=UPI001CF23F40|nr:DUF2634 domain-containing protein [Clostridium tagluense]MCB2300939.1 DUF2634 domain-containing protein [Clostridium tagluense]